jgi:hypothetical protein
VIFVLLLLLIDRIQRAEGYVIGAALMNYQTDLTILTFLTNKDLNYFSIFFKNVFDFRMMCILSIFPIEFLGYTIIFR